MNKTKKAIIILSIILINSKLLIGQVNIPQFETPKPSTLTPNIITGNQTGQPNFFPNYNQTNGLTNTQISNNAAMQEVGYYEKLRQEQNNLINDAVTQSNNNSISYNLPSFKGEKGTENFQNAFNQINDMLLGKQPLDLKKAVFLTENAYLGNRLDYSKYSNAIKQMVNLCKIKIKQEKGNPNDELTKKIMLYRFMSDTLQFYDYQAEKKVYTYPMTYDFDDFEGKEDWTKMFVTKLMNEGKGQCHSLPLHYMILSQEIGTEAFLSYSPSHSYVKIRDKYNRWYNLELTNGLITSDAAVVESGYVKSEALLNKVYLDTIGIKKVVASTLVDLAQGYKNRYGYDDFVLQCAEKSLEYFPTNTFAMQLKSDYLTIRFDYVAWQYGRPPLEVLQQDPKAMEIFAERNEMYLKLDNSGFEQMPPDKYQDWLKSLSIEKNKEIHKQKYIQLNKVNH